MINSKLDGLQEQKKVLEDERECRDPSRSSYILKDLKKTQVDKLKGTLSNLVYEQGKKEERLMKLQRELEYVKE